MQEKMKTLGKAIVFPIETILGATKVSSRTTTKTTINELKK